MAVDLAQVGITVTRAEAQRDMILSRKANLGTLSSELTARLGAVELAQALIQQTAKETQEQLRFHLQDLVQGALDAVFPGAYTFKVGFEMKRGRTEVDMYLDKDGTRMDPMDSNGGGVVDVISLSLRIACWAISRTDNVLILDEPFKFIRGNPRMLLGEMVQKLSKRLKLQVVMVADVANTPIEADREFTVGMKSRKSLILKAT